VDDEQWFMDQGLASPGIAKRAKMAICWVLEEESFTPVLLSCHSAPLMPLMIHHMQHAPCCIAPHVASTLRALFSVAPPEADAH